MLNKSDTPIIIKNNVIARAGESPSLFSNKDGVGILFNSNKMIGYTLVPNEILGQDVIDKCFQMVNDEIAKSISDIAKQEQKDRAWDDFYNGRNNKGPY